MGRVVDDLVRLVQAGLTRETLPEPPPEPPPAGRRPSVLRTLLGRETLPEARVSSNAASTPRNDSAFSA